MPDHRAANLAIIRERWPRVADWLTPALNAIPPAADPPVDETAGGVPRVGDLLLESRHDPEAEARSQARGIPEGARRAWIYGVGGGALPRLLLARSPLESLTLVPLAPAGLAHALVWRDHTGWLADPRLRIALALEEGRVRHPFAASPPCLELAPPGTPEARLRDRLRLELATPFINRELSGHLLLFQRLEANRARLSGDGDVASLRGSRPGGRVAVAVSGPTLRAHLQWLAHRSPDWFLMAAGSALPTLLGEGVVPDLVLTIDPYPIHALSFSADLSALAGVPLVYFPVVEPAILEGWPGPRLAAYSASPLYRELAREHPRGELFSAGSVLHPLVDLAVGLGAAEVLLLGADLGFPGGHSHADGYADHSFAGLGRSVRQVPDGQGGGVTTVAALDHFRLDLEEYVASHPEVAFYNGHRVGARIEGVQPLERAVWGGELAGRLVPWQPPPLLRPGEGAPDAAVAEFLGAVRELLAQNRLEEAATLLGEGEPPWEEHLTGAWWQMWAELELVRGNLVEAGRRLDSALAQQRHAGDLVGQMGTLRVVARFYARLNRYSEAHGVVGEAMALAAQEWELAELARCHLTLGELLLEGGDEAEGLRSWDSAENLFQQVEEVRGAWEVRQKRFTHLLRRRTDGVGGGGNATLLLESAGEAYRLGAVAEGGERLRRGVDALGQALGSGAVREAVRLPPLLNGVTRAQEARDWLGLADLLEYDLPGLLGGGTGE